MKPYELSKPLSEQIKEVKEAVIREYGRLLTDEECIELTNRIKQSIRADEEKKKRRRRIVRNAIQCKHCGDIIESTSMHDFKKCSCGAVSVDGGHDYLRRAYQPSEGEDYEELSVFEDVPIDCQKIYTVEEIKERITPVAEAAGLKAVYLFGSYARGEATGNSDIDLLVDVTGATVSRAWGYGGLYADFQDVLHKDIDMLTPEEVPEPKFLGDTFKESVMRDRIKIYG